MTQADPAYSNTFDDLFDLLSGTQSLTGLLHEVTSRAVAVVPPALSCGLTVRIDGEALTQSSSDAFAARMDEIQYQVDDGPCLAALRDGRTVTISDLAGDHRWPDFRERGLAEGLAACLSIPMVAAGQSVGGLNLYAKTPHAFDDAASERGHHYAAQAGGAVGLAIRLADQLRHSADLEAALASRTHIDQALGIIMGQQRCTAERAFAILSQHSQNTNTKLRDVATRMIRTVSGQPPGPTPSVR